MVLWVIHVHVQALSVQRCPSLASDAPPEPAVETLRVTQAGGTLGWGSPFAPASSRTNAGAAAGCRSPGKSGHPQGRASTTARTGKGCFLGAGWAFFEGRGVWKHGAQIKARSSLTHTPRARQPIFLALPKNSWKSPTPDFVVAVINTLRNLEHSCSLIPSGLLEYLLEYINV